MAVSAQRNDEILAVAVGRTLQLPHKQLLTIFYHIRERMVTTEVGFGVRRKSKIKAGKT